MFFKRVLDLHDVFAKEEKTPRWEISLGSYRVADGSGGGDCGKGEVLKAERPLCLGSRHIGRECRVASGNPLVQRFPSNPALRAVPSSAQVEEYSVDFTLTCKIPDPPAGHMCYRLRLVCGHPTGIPQYGSRKVSVLAADQARPILDYKPLEDIVQESDFAAWKNTKQVAVKIPEDLTEVQRGRIGGLRREHVPQHLP
jgi:hypothetical protein